ncbi:MAG TPA: GNAT family N-acetyltransferase, partial [Acidimicrobiales bacterium]
AVDDHDNIVGCVTYVHGPDHPHAEFTDVDAAGFRMLAVDPAAQGAGIGRALVEWCVDEARSSGRRRLLIHSGAWMTRAHALYSSMGFVRRPDMDWIPVPEIHLLGFSLEL